MKRTIAWIWGGACALPLNLGWTAPSFSRGDVISKPSIDFSIYRHVVHVGWVVKDLDRVVHYWETLGLKNIRRTVVQESPERTYRGKKTHNSRKMAFGNIGGVQIVWIQPLTGESAADEFLRKHGDGIHHLAYTVASSQRLDEQIKYFGIRGVGIVQEETWEGTKGKGGLANLDTAQEGGGLTIELICNDPYASPSEEAPPAKNDYPFWNIVQYAFVVHDVEKVAAFYERLGFGGMPVEHNISVHRSYRGLPGNFEMVLGWWNWGDVTFEWIQPLSGPNVYEEYLKAHGEGFHHLAFEVTDMDKAVKLFRAKGVPVSQSGGWDSPDSKGRFAYLDTEPYGGVTIELLWNQS